MLYNLIPPGVSLVLGIVFLVTSDSRPLVKFIVVGLFLLGTYFQFFSGYRLVGVLIQVGLAIGLALWMKLA